MKRRPLTQAELLARMPRAFRPRLDAQQLVELGICHNQNFDAITTGTDPGPQMVWDYYASVLTWWRVAQLLQIGQPEMAVQLEVAVRLAERWRRTGAVRFDGPDMELARTGIVVMDQLAQLVDRPTAMEACDWSEAEINRLASAVATLRQGEGQPA